MRLEASNTFILPKLHSKIPRSGCYLARESDNLYVIYNGVKFVTDFRQKDAISSISSTTDKVVILLNEDQSIIDTIAAVQNCAHLFEGKTVIIENVCNREFILKVLKTIYKKEIIGLYLTGGIVISRI